MTRLCTTHIENIPHVWDEYEERLQKVTSHNLFSLCCKIFDTNIESAKIKCQNQRLAVIPIHNQGEGSIKGFSEALQSTALHLGIQADILANDEKGFQEYLENDLYTMCIWANDDVFMVEHKKGNKADNNIATGYGYAEALHCILRKNKKETHNQKILIRGCGPIGTNASKYLSKLGYHIYLFDLDEKKSYKLFDTLEKYGKRNYVLKEEDLKKEILSLDALIDAAPKSAKGTWLWDYDIKYLAAPCVPCEWHVTDTRWHDPLQLGTAVMLIAASLNHNLTDI